MHGSRFLSERRWEREKEERMMKVSNESEEERGEKRRGEEEKAENGTGDCEKEDVRVLVLLKPLTFLVKEEIWRVVVIFLGKTSSV